MIYDIKLRITYDYASPAVGGRHQLCLMPLDIPGAQRLVAGLIDISPRPDERIDRLDFFGNRTVEISFRAPHDSIALTLQARVERMTDPGAPGPSCPLSALPDDLFACRDMGPGSPLHFLAPSTRAPIDPAMTAFARKALRPGMTAAQAILAVGSALHRHMRFDPEATTVDTPASEAFAKRHGVCQDFSHILIACLRGIGVPAGYVSGFLRTLPPPGKPRLEGADAMHAWVQAWAGTAAGWIEFDPTNDRLAGTDHLVVARGRDYSDVTPVKGILRAAGRQATHQAVDVVPVSP